MGDARRRSNALVTGRTRPVLACVVLLYALTVSLGWALLLAHPGFVTATLITFAWSTLTAPLQAHALTVV